MTIDVLTGEVLESRTAEQWAALVRADLGQAVAGFIAAGKHLIQAKVEIPHGGWEAWLRTVGISPTKALWLMELARHPAITNPLYVTDLPPSYATLYELAQLEPQWLEAAINNGRVHPELERKAARALVIEYKQKAADVHFKVACDALKAESMLMTEQQFVRFLYWLRKLTLTAGDERYLSRLNNMLPATEPA